MINGVAHGPMTGTTTCQLHMRSFKDGDDDLHRAVARAAFPVIKDLVVDRSALDRIIAAGGFISAPTGGAPDAQRDSRPEGSTPTARWTRPRASAAARAWRPARTARRRCSPRPRSRTSACCRRASRSATAARSQMVAQMDAEGFGGCTLYGECQAACPKEISIDTIARMNRDFLRGSVAARADGSR